MSSGRIGSGRGNDRGRKAREATEARSPTPVIANLLRSYPRTRPPLPAAHRAIYEDEYRSNRDGSRPIAGLAKRMESWMHRQVGVGDPQCTVLELGAGTLNHLPFEPSPTVYDIVEPFRRLFEGSEGLGRVRDTYAALADVPTDRLYDFIISVAVLEHMDDLPAEIARCCLHLKPHGELRAGIPSEGGLLWWLAWRSTTGVSYWLRNRLDYGKLMRHEHVTTAPEIAAIVDHFFEQVSITRFPTPLHHASLYTAIRARRPRLSVARSFLSTR